MKKSNVDTSRIPKFNSHEEALVYFNKWGKLTFFGKIGGFDDGYYVYTFDHFDGRQFFLDVYDNGRIVLELRDFAQNF
ncbi:hypothetical protein BC351_01040 [Paenibacillus ferrarius]|uniref:Uncharacterized protein n=1 Tax=Paenibacillus ferrarius TaxID=1469647 RepID=A0A1V4HSU1_9BACL|nr:hypothetical protein [Paenibacillus ferrarius]OPH61858.1 hypothetical protein BC351_01040 [Paenibacillus ferrarius]